MLLVYLNSKRLYMKTNDRPGPSPENPDWVLNLSLPRVSLEWNGEGDYHSKGYSLGLIANTQFEVVSTDGGLVLSLTMILFGFGFSLSRQATY